MREEPSSGIELIATPFIEEIGAADRSELAIDLVNADLVCSVKEELVTEAEKEVPALARLVSIKFTFNP